jgi:hypothetical protein
MSQALISHANKLQAADPKLGPVISAAIAQTAREIDALAKRFGPLIDSVHGFKSDQSGGLSIDRLAITNMISAPFAWGQAGAVQRTSSFLSPVRVLPTQSNFLCDASAGLVVHQLTSATKVPIGREFTLKKIDNTANAARFQAQPGETIDGANTLDITVQYTSRTIYSDGFNWWIK